MSLKNTIRYEEAAMFLLGVYFFSLTDFVWWIFPLLLLAPDVGMAGYLVNSKTGAAMYNLFHHKGVAIFLLLCGYILPSKWVLLSGIILFAHASLDRMLGFGLKYPDDFKHTHLGWIGEPKSTPE